MHKVLESTPSMVKLTINSTGEREPLSRKTRLVHSECQDTAAILPCVASCISMFFFVEVLLEALFLSVDPYMRYSLPPQVFMFVGP